MRRRHELTDEQWDRLKDHLPGKAGDPGRSGADNRLFVNAVLYVLKTGIPWEDLPERLGKPNSVWKRYDRWCASGVWERVAKVLGDRTWPTSRRLRNCSWTPPASKPTRSPPPGGGCRGKKRRRRHPPVPGPIPRRADHQTARGGRWRGATASAGDHRRAMRRRPAGPGAARRSAARSRDRRCGLRQ